MNERKRGAGSRYLYEPFEKAAVQIEAHEKIFDARWDGLERRLQTIENMLERLDRRLWLAVYGVVGFILTQGALGLMQFTNL